MKFSLPLLAVQDVNVSKEFYKQLFKQEVILDLGKMLPLAAVLQSRKTLHGLLTLTLFLL